MITKPNKTLLKPLKATIPYLPTQEQIAEDCAEFQASWSPAQEQTRIAPRDKTKAAETTTYRINSHAGRSWTATPVQGE